VPLLFSTDTDMAKETPKDAPRQQPDDGSLAQTDEPWKGNPEKEQRSGTKTKKSDPDLWQETNTHLSGEQRGSQQANGRQRTQGCGQEAIAVKDDARRRDRLDQAQQKGR
jgi:hypothetical protein